MQLEESKLQAPDGHGFVLRHWRPRETRGGLLFLPALYAAWFRVPNPARV